MAAHNCLWCHLQASSNQPHKHSKSCINKCFVISVWSSDKNFFLNAQKFQHNYQSLSDPMPYSQLFPRNLTQRQRQIPRQKDWIIKFIYSPVQNEKSLKITCSVDFIQSRKLCFHNVKFTIQHRFRIIQLALLARVHLLKK